MIISKNQVYVPKPRSQKINQISTQIANALSIELLNYGIVLSDELFYNLIRTNPDDVFEIANILLKEHTIGELNRPLFQNWENRDDFLTFDRLATQIFAYAFQISGNDLYDPEYMRNLKSKVNYDTQIIVMLAHEVEARRFFETHKNVKTHKKQQRNMALAFKFFGDENEWIQNPEARAQAMLTKKNPFVEMPLAIHDVLRYFAVKNDSNQWNLPHNVLYSKLTWQDRLSVMEFLSGWTNEKLFEAFGQNRQAWERFINHGKFLRQKQFRQQYPRIVAIMYASMRGKLEGVSNHRVSAQIDKMLANQTLQTVGSNLVYRTFASRVEESLNSKDWSTAYELLKQRPNYLLQNLNKILSTIPNTESRSMEVLVRDYGIPNASHNILFALAQINPRARKRIIDVKGETRVEDVNYDISLMQNIKEMSENEIRSRYKVDGKIWVDPALQNNVVPFLAKNQELTRGSTISFEDKKYLHFFMHWVQEEYRRTDLDHSWRVVKKGGKFEQIAFYNQTNAYIKQSGDITNAPAPNGGTEYSVIDLEKIPSDVLYIVPGINVYSGDDFKNLPTSYAGFMFNDNNKFDLNRDHVKYDLTEPSRFNVPFVIDIKNRRIIIIDFNEKHSHGSLMSSNGKVVNELIDAALDLDKMTIGKFADLLSTDGRVQTRIVNELIGEKDITPDNLGMFVQ